MKTQIMTYTVGSYFLPYFYNGDMSGLLVAEAQAVGWWIKSVTADFTDSDQNHWTFMHFGDNYDHNEFGWCEIMELHSDVHKVDLVFSLRPKDTV